MITVRSRENTDSNSVLVSKNGGGVVGNDHNPMIMEKREKRNNSHHYNGNNYHNHHQNDGGSKHQNQQPTMTILGSNREANNVTVSPQIQQQQHRSKYYNNKSRGGNVGGVKSSNINDVVMLQRPTILAKPQVEIEPQEDRSNKVSNVILEAKVDRQQTPVNVDQQPPVQLLLENKKTRRINEEVKKEVVEPAANPIKSYTETISSRLIGGTQMTSSVRLLDEYLQWQESPLNDYLLDNNNGFLVVGVLGKKGTGKSTLMSQLAASSSVFRAAQSSDPARHCTSGIDAFVTTERTILLDVQPLLSASVLDRAIAVSSEKKTATSNLVGADFKYYENYVELQSLELACFVLAVCNVVIVLEDWFCDPNLLRLLLTAEMLLPNMNTVFAQSKDANKDGCNTNMSLSVTGDELQQHIYEHHPHLIYVLNKTEYVNRFEMSKMKMTLNTLLRESKLLNYRGSLSSTPEPAYSYRSTRPNKKSAANDWENVNLVCLPKSGGNSHVLNDFRGFPGSDRCVKMLLKEILSIKRSNSVFMSPVSSGSNAAAANLAATNREQIFTEKKWFNFAGKVWEAIRKSPLIAEYNRLMT